METENEGLPRGVRFPVDFMCRMLGVSRAGYYAWRYRGPSAHAVRDAELTEKIREVDEEHKHRCGIERILWELQEDGLMDLAAPGAAAGARGGGGVRAPASVRAHDAAGRAGPGRAGRPG